MNLRKYNLHPIPFWVYNLMAFAGIVSISTFLISTYAMERVARVAMDKRTAARALVPLASLVHNPFDGLALTAKAAIVYNARTQDILFGLNEEQQLPLASLTKLMTALVASEILPPYTSITVIPRRTDGDVFLKSGEQWDFKDLVNYTLMTSSNTGADSIAAAASAVMDGLGTGTATSSVPQTFIDEMNKRALELGLTQTYYLNTSGLDTDGNLSGAYGSARDIARLFSYVLTTHPELVSLTNLSQATLRGPDGRLILAHNTDVIVSHIPGIIGSKTGLTDLAGGNLAVAFDASFGQPYIVVVLGSTDADRFTDVEQLVKATISYLGSSMQAIKS